MNSVNQKKLLHSKWTAVNPTKREKHFVITEVEYGEDGNVIHCLMEAVMTRRVFPIDWQELKDSNVWVGGWQS
ncbi:MAG: TIGR02450 family Trp-rich protein [Desulfobacterales bacterium]